MRQTHKIPLPPFPKGDNFSKPVYWVFAILTLCLSAHADDRAEIITRELEAANQIQVKGQGYAEPANYILKAGSLLEGGAQTQRHADAILTTIDEGVENARWPTYIHHEYAHACQIAMNGPSRSVFMDEASATLQEMLAFGDGSWKNAVAEFQQHPEISPFVDVAELTGRLESRSKYEYGGALFLRFLEEEFGVADGRLVRQMWSRASLELPNVDNVRWVQIVEEVVGHSFDELVTRFANWRLKGLPPKSISITSLNAHDIGISSFDWPLPFGCLVLRVPSLLIPQSFSLRIEGDRALGMSWQKMTVPSGRGESGVLRWAGGVRTTSWAIEGHQELFLSICNLDRAAFERRELIGHSLKIAIVDGAAKTFPGVAANVSGSELSVFPAGPSCSSIAQTKTHMVWMSVLLSLFWLRMSVKGKRKDGVHAREPDADA